MTLCISALCRLKSSQKGGERGKQSNFENTLQAKYTAEEVTCASCHSLMCCNLDCVNECGGALMARKKPTCIIGERNMNVESQVHEAAQPLHKNHICTIFNRCPSLLPIEVQDLKEGIFLRIQKF